MLINIRMKINVDLLFFRWKLRLNFYKIVLHGIWTYWTGVWKADTSKITDHRPTNGHA